PAEAADLETDILEDQQREAEQMDRAANYETQELLKEIKDSGTEVDVSALSGPQVSQRAKPSARELIDRDNGKYRKAVSRYRSRNESNDRIGLKVQKRKASA